MKKGLKSIAIIVITLLAIQKVKADEVNYIYTLNKSECNYNYQTYNQYESLINEELEEYANSTDYYVITKNEAGNLNDINLIIFDDQSTIGYVINENENNFYVQNYKVMIQFYNNEVSGVATRESFGGDTHRNFSSFLPNNLIYGNYDFKLEGYSEITFQGFYEDNINIKSGETLPYLVNLYNYDSWEEYVTDNNPLYTEVDLDDYEYVLLSLKDYSQTQAFQTNMYVMGQIGITPIYNYGQTTKDAITGVQVQDRCNVQYNEYTTYPFYILQTDLQNNAVYAVKECEQGSKFKFDNTVFNITYITDQNIENPTITIDGKTYNVIPYDDLPSTATKNEEDNYIPGESGSATDTAGLDSAVKGAQQKLSEIWNTFTYFTSFVNQLFTTLPIEVQTVLISAFTIAIILGLIKIFIS